MKSTFSQKIVYKKNFIILNKFPKPLEPLIGFSVLVESKAKDSHCSSKMAARISNKLRADKSTTLMMQREVEIGGELGQCMMHTLSSRCS